VAELRTIDNSGAENHCTIYTICESPVNNDIIWAGTDDGNCQITVDGGKHWANVIENIPDLPACTWCSSIEAGHFEEGTAYATFDGHRTGDMKIEIYKQDGELIKTIPGGKRRGINRVHWAMRLPPQSPQFTGLGRRCFDGPHDSYRHL